MTIGIKLRALLETTIPAEGVAHVRLGHSAP
jgi:hypothetical protein